MDALGKIIFCIILHIHLNHTIHLTNGCQLITSNIINNGSILILPNTLSKTILLRPSRLYHTLKEHHKKVKKHNCSLHSLNLKVKRFRKKPQKTAKFGTGSGGESPGKTLANWSWTIRSLISFFCSKSFSEVKFGICTINQQYIVVN